MYKATSLEKLLARCMQKHALASTVHCVIDQPGKTHSKNEDIAQQFLCFYSKLYNRNEINHGPTGDKAHSKLLQEFLCNFSPRALSDSDCAALEVPLSSEEWEVALKTTKPGKSSGPDGFTAQYYKCYTDLLAPHFLKAFNTLSTASCPSVTLLEAYISVIPKEKKDPTNVTNYRPISLLNVDVKLFSKMLATCLSYHVTAWVGMAQVGFVPGREARDNTIKALNLHHWLTSTQREGFFLAMDAEKAFHRVAWDYMDAVLAALGLGRCMLAFIRALYVNPRARVKVNGRLSDAFPIHIGTRQGCPTLHSHLRTPFKMHQSQSEHKRYRGS